MEEILKEILKEVKALRRDLNAQGFNLVGEHGPEAVFNTKEAVAKRSGA